MSQVWAVDDITGSALATLPPRRFTDLTDGRLGVAARPGMRRPSWLATDIMRALGASEDVSGAGRPGETSRTLAAAWLRAYDIRDLYVQFAWSISIPSLLAAVHMAARAGCDLWLVGDTGYSDAIAAALTEFDPRTVTEDVFLQRWSHLATDPPGHPSRHETPEQLNVPASPLTSTAADATGWPQSLPSDDFTTFRAACRDLLAAETFAVVDATYRACHQEATQTLAPLLAAPEVEPTLEDHKGRPVERQVAGWLAGHWEQAPSWQHFLTRVRATQAAMFTAGWYLQVDLDTFIGTATTMPRAAMRNEETWARLKLHAQPSRSSACAMSAAGIGVDTMAQLNVGSYSHETGTVTTAGGEVFVIEAPARIFLRAQQLHRRYEGADDNDLLLVKAGTGQPIAARTIASIIRQVRRELGTAVALAPPDRLTPDPSRWSRRFGISVQELT